MRLLKKSSDYFDDFLILLLNVRCRNSLAMCFRDASATKINIYSGEYMPGSHAGLEFKPGLEMPVNF